MTSTSTEGNFSKDTTPVVETEIKGTIDTLAISESLGYQVHRKRKRNKWTYEQDQKLTKLLIGQYKLRMNIAEYNGEKIDVDTIDWAAIAIRLDNRKAKECRKRWVSSLDPNLRKGKWTKEEDDLLVSAYKRHGPQWQKVASEIDGRNDDQCSKRYTEVLHSDTKERLKPWRMDEDLTLIDGVKQYGTKWRTISNSLPGRPSLTCRNRWRKIMTDIAKNSACEEIKKAVGVLDKNGTPLISFKNDSKIKSTTEDSIEKINKRKATDSQSQQEIFKRTKIDDSKATSSSPRVFSPPISTARFTPPTRNTTEWKFSLVDPATNEEIPSFSGSINSHDIAQHLIDLAKFNGVNVIVHQHIHHHYTPSSNNNHDPQANVNRYTHFNYLPPLTEVPKLTSSSSPDNTNESTGSSKVGDTSLVKFIGEEKLKNRQKKKAEISQSSRQQLYPSSNGSLLKNSTKNNSEVNVSNNNGKQFGQSKSTSTASDYKTEDLEEELDFWETMRSITQPIAPTTKPVSQHHPLHHSQPSNFKVQSPYQQSDSFGVSRFPNMASPLPTSNDKTQNKNAVNIGSLSTESRTPGNYGGIYVNDDREDEDEEEEEEMDIANQYGMYYNVFANNAFSSAKPNSNADDNSSTYATNLANSGYLMPFNPS